MTIYMRKIIAALVLALGFGAVAYGTAQAQAFPRKYSLTCTGSACTTTSCSASGPVGVVGIISLASVSLGSGSVASNANYGSIIVPSASSPFNLSIINGKANQKSVGGNSIPIGCFVAVFAFPSGGPAFLANTFGCYANTQHDFYLVSQVKNTTAGTFTCHGQEM